MEQLVVVVVVEETVVETAAGGTWNAHCRSMMKGCETRERIFRSTLACVTIFWLVVAF